PVPVTVAGTPRLVYELYLTNFASQGLEPISLEVRDAATGEVLVRYAGDELSGRLQQRADAGSSTGLAVRPGAVVIAYVELGIAQPPHALDHRMTFRPAGQETAARAITGA